jgi:polysaccharide biosynthesis protein PslG
MRILAGLLSVLCFLAPVARPALADNEIVLDDDAPSVQIHGTWAATAATSGYIGSGYHYRVAGDGTSTFTWPFSGPAGHYEVFARWTSGANRASNASYTVTSASGAATVTVDQRNGGGAWSSLGVFDFNGAADQAVRLTDKADGIVVADAVRWVPSQNASGATQSASGPADPRFFAETRFRIDSDAFWDFFQKRGGVRTFGFPVSRAFTFFGCQTQFFQRLAMQQCGDAGVGTLNVLDAGLLPYDHFHGSTVPAPDPKLIASAPLPSQPDYAAQAIDFVRANTPETFGGEPVHFLTTFNSTVSLSDAFPDGHGDPNLLPLLNLQLWGLPTSAPAVDPNNHDFIYQRFQRGVMHYDKGCGCTQALLLTDYLKGLLTGDLLPDDLAAEAASSPLLRAVPAHHDLHATAFGDAFTVQSPQAPPPPTAAPAPPPQAAAAPVSASSPDYGMSMFLWGHPDTTGRDLKLVTDLGFRWQKTLFQWRAIEGGCKGCFDWTEADRVVKASAAAGVNTIARLDFQPTWARKDGASNGPPDNYQDYADFVSAFVSRYGAPSTIGRVAAIEIWNEVNLDREWGGATINQQQARDYVRLLSAAYSAAKTADPSVTVITAGLSPTGVTNGHSADDVTYLQWLFDGGIKGHYDVLGAHGNTQAPEVDAAPGSLGAFPHPSFYFRRIEQLRDVMVKNGDADKRVWLLEFGWTSDAVHPNYSWFAVSEDKKAANIVKALQYASQKWQPWIGVMTLWTLPDPGWTPDREEYWWAITNADGSPRAAYTALLQARRGGALAGIAPVQGGQT